MMSLEGLYPRSQWRPTSSYGEKLVYDALKRELPTGWVAWHSVRVREGGREGEGDFLIAIPDRGLLVVEVKGGRIEVRDGQWSQDGRALTPAPREQAHGFLRLFLRKLESVYRGPRPFAQIVTAFPQTRFVTEPSHGDVAGAVLGAQDLPHLGAALVSLANRLLRAGGAPANRGWVDAIHDVWGETWLPSLSLGDAARVRAEEMACLDNDQIRLLDLVAHNPRMLVLGGPGTGKTLLARHLCERRRGEGSRVLFLCWTRALALGLRREGMRDAWPVRELAVHLLEKACVAIAGGAPESAWTTEVWESIAALAAANVAGDAYDLVIVDEAQDFAEGDWTLVNALAGKGALWAFGDEAQGFWTDRPTPGSLFPASFRLLERYRCPEALARFADQYRPRGHGAPGPPEGRFDELSVIVVPSAELVPRAIAATVATLVENGARPGQIAVISLAGQTKTSLCIASDIAGVPVVRADADDAAEHVVADTFLRFKGLERAWVIVVDLERGQAHRYDTRMHIALTRATVTAVVLGTEEEIAADVRLVAARG